MSQWKNDFAGADAAHDQSRAGLDNMIGRQEDYKSLVGQMAQVFAGPAGSDNQVFQARFEAAVQEFFDSLRGLNGALLTSVSTGGTVQTADITAGQRFTNIG